MIILLEEYGLNPMFILCISSEDVRALDQSLFFSDNFWRDNYFFVFFSFFFPFLFLDASCVIKKDIWLKEM